MPLTLSDLASRTRPMAEHKPKKWIAEATSNAHGQFRAKAERAGMSTRAFAKKHEHDSDKTGKQARLAEALMGMHHGKPKSPLYTHPRSRKD